MAIRDKAAARPTALLAWSSGKDSAWALHILRQRRQVDVVGLLTTVNETDQRVAMHAVRAEVLDAQARCRVATVAGPDPRSVQQCRLRGGDGRGHGAGRAGGDPIHRVRRPLPG